MRMSSESEGRCGLTSRDERWEYGTGTKIPDDISKINLTGGKTHEFKKNSVCPVCDAEKEMLFPIVDAVFCYKCANELAEWKKKYMIVKQYANIAKTSFCFKCGRDVNFGVSISTRVCVKCLDRAGDYEMARNVRKYARRVA